MSNTKQSKFTALCLAALTLFGTSGANAQTFTALQQLAASPTEQGGNKSGETQNVVMISTPSEFLKTFAQTNGTQVAGTIYRLASDINLAFYNGSSGWYQNDFDPTNTLQREFFQYTISVNSNVTLDGNGHQLTYTNATSADDNSYTFISSNQGTIKNLRVSLQKEPALMSEPQGSTATSFVYQNYGTIEGCVFNFEDTNKPIETEKGCDYDTYGGVVHTMWREAKIRNCVVNHVYNVDSNYEGTERIVGRFSTNYSPFVYELGSSTSGEITNCLVSARTVDLNAEVEAGDFFDETVPSKYPAYGGITTKMHPFVCTKAETASTAISNCYAFLPMGESDNANYEDNSEAIGYTLVSGQTMSSWYDNAPEEIKSTFYKDAEGNLTPYSWYAIPTDADGYIVLNDGNVDDLTGEGLQKYIDVYASAPAGTFPAIDFNKPKYTMDPTNPLTDIPMGVTIDMKGQTIYIYESTPIPYVDSIAEGATLKNAVFNVTVAAIPVERVHYMEGDANDYQGRVGVICGANYGNIVSCGVEGAKGAAGDMHYSFIKGDYTSSVYSQFAKLTLGALVGYNAGTIRSCYSMMGATIDLKNFSGGEDAAVALNNDTVTIGGVAGENVGTITDCLVTGATAIMANTDVEVGPTTGDIQTPQPVTCGNICGNSTGTVENAYYVAYTQSDNGVYVSVPDEANGGYTTNTDLESRTSAAEGTRVYKLEPVAGPQEGLLYYNTSDFVKTKFTDIAKWKYDVESEDLTLTFVDMEVAPITEEEGAQIEINIESEEDMKEATELIFSQPDLYSNANINITTDIDMQKVETPDAESYANLPKFEGFGSTDKAFTGTITGSTQGDDGEEKGITISNFSANLNGKSLFNNIAEGAVISGISFDSAKIYNPKIVEVTDSLGNPKNVVAVFGDSNNGTISNCSFSGTVVIDGEEQEICLVGDNAGNIEKCFFYIDYKEQPAATTGNKSCIVLKQNIGIGRNTGTVKKVAINKPKTNKSETLINPLGYSKKEIEQDIREYTDEELASGEAAYWMNFDEKGYSGNYSPIWKKGVKQPVLAKNGANDAVYKLDIFTNKPSEAENIVADMFYNAGQEVTVTYDGNFGFGNLFGDEVESPISIKVDNQTKTFGDGEVTFTMPVPTSSTAVKMEILYSLTAVDGVSSALSIAAQGNTIAISDAEAAEAYIYNAAGQMVSRIALTDGSGTATISGTGIYIIKAGSQTAKVMVK